MSSPLAISQSLHDLVSSTYSESSSQDRYSLYTAKHRITSLCLSLLRSVQGPEEYTALLAESCQEAAALNVITALGVPDLIAAAPNVELSLETLAEQTKSDEQYLSVMLSALTYHGYFEEHNGVFKNNTFSNVLRTAEAGHGKGSMKDAVGLAADDGAKSATALLQATKKDAQGKTAAAFAYGFDGSTFEFMASPGNEWRGQRVGRAMVQLHGMANGTIGADFAWEALKTPIIDVGGGIGSFEMMLLGVEKNQNLQFTIFDITKTVENSKKSWATKPQWMQDKISFVAGDFMKATPEESKIPTNGGTYVIRHVLHDWTDTQVLDILTNTRTAMLASSPKPRPKLVVVEMVLREDSSRFTHTTSLQLLSLNGGIVRTEARFRELFAQAGFAVDKVQGVCGVDLVMVLDPNA